MAEPQTTPIETLELAGRGARFLARCLDNLALGLPGGLAAGAVVLTYPGGFKAWEAAKPVGPMPLWFWLLFLALLTPVVICDCLWLRHHGQTIGKRALGIRLVRSDGTLPSLSRVICLRTAVVGLMEAIPLVGLMVALLDCLFIFGKDRRCLHDLIADTWVVRVQRAPVVASPEASSTSSIAPAL